MMYKLLENGLIHSDFNEFNLIIGNDDKLTMIDFPQMVSRFHINADFYFNRDVECIKTFFKRRFGFEASIDITLENVACKNRLDRDLKASGFIKKELKNDINDVDFLVILLCFLIMNYLGRLSEK